LPITNPCPNGSITVGTGLTSGQLANIVTWDWKITLVSTPTTSVYTSTSANPGTVPAPTGGWQPGATYQVRLRMEESCCGWSIPVYRTFTVAPTLAAAGPITQSPTGQICANTNGVTYSIPAVSGATSYVWTVNGGTIASGQGTTSITVNWGAANNGASVSVVPTNACAPSTNGAAATFNLSINGLPAVSVVTQGAAPTTFCLGSGVTLQANTTSGGGVGNGSFTWNWTPGNSSGSTLSVTPATAGTFTYSVTATEGGSGCSSSDDITLTVTSPIAQTITGPAALCFGSTATYTATTSGGTWSSSNASVATVNASTGLVTAVAAGTTTLTYTVTTAGNCVNTATYTVTVYPAFAAGAVTGGASSTVCYNFDPSLLTANPTGGAGSYTYQWQSSPVGCNTWTNISGATASTFDPPAVTGTICYRVIVDATGSPDCGNATASSNTITFTLESTPPSITCPAAVTVQCASAVPAVNLGSVTTSDNCPGTVAVTFGGDGTSNQVCANQYTLTRTYVATDLAGNSSSCTQVITVNDNTAPTVTCPAAITVNATTGQCSAPVSFAATSTDNCGGSTVSYSIASGSTFAVGTTAVTATATDVCGNSSTCAFSVTVVDNQAPTITCPSNISVNTTSTTCDAPVSYNAPVGTDNCAGATTAQLGGLASGSSFPLGVTTNSFQVTDAAGATASCSFTVTVTDATAPNAICQNVTVQLNNTGNGSLTASQVNNGSNDNCNVASISLNPTAFTCVNVGANTVTLTVTDGSGNTSTCTATASVQDNVAPVAVCQSVTVQLNSAGNASTTAAAINNGSSDACGVASLSLSNSAFSCANLGSNNVVLTVTDVNGNSSTCSATVTVQDLIAPTAICQNLTLQLNNAGSATTTASAANNGSSDNCGTVTLSLSQTTFSCSRSLI
ncbi:MAG: HYR domain-containing protein, partial [Bacteroidia bacterium]